jgi:RNA polymerase sigma factor (sigma-70 family)
MPDPSRFRSTVWSDIELARRGDIEALNRLAAQYRIPIVRFVRRRGLSAEDAEDLAQEVLLEIVGKKLLDKAEPSAGRFRSLVLAVTKNVCKEHWRRQNAVKRSGGPEARTVSADAQIPSRDPGPGEDAVFDQIWLVYLLEKAYKKLEKDASVLKNRQDEIVRLSIGEGLSYTEIAQRLKLEPGVVRNVCHRGKQKLTAYLREEIAEYSEPGEDQDRETDHILRLLGDSPGP